MTQHYFYNHSQTGYSSNVDESSTSKIQEKGNYEFNLNPVTYDRGDIDRKSASIESIISSEDEAKFYEKAFEIEK